jgi:hypothetical protein
MRPNPRFAWAVGAEQGGAAAIASGAVALAYTVAVANTGAVDCAVSVMGFLNASVPRRARRPAVAADPAAVQLQQGLREGRRADDRDAWAWSRSWWR